MTKKVFHRIDPAVFEKMSNAGATWQDVKKIYKHPSWCGYGTSALDGYAGCWSLVSLKIRCKNDCKNCDAFFEPAMAIKEEKSA